MKLNSLVIEQLYSTRRISLLELGSSVHIILGANGSGKSSSVLAIQGLLWPEALAHIPFPQLKSEWSFEGKTLRIERKGAVTQWSLDANNIAAPPVPPAHLANCYTLTLDDLFEGDDTELAEEIERDFAGGYDFKLLRNNELHAVSKAVVSKTRKELQARRKTLRETALSQQTLAQKEGLLDQQYAEIAHIKQNQRRERFLDKALERLDCLKRAKERQQELSRFPQPLARYKGYEAKHYQELSEKAAASRKELQATEARLAEAESLTDKSVHTAASDTIFDEALCKARVESLRLSLQELQNLELNRKEEQLRIEDLSAKVPGMQNVEASVKLDASQLEEISQAFRACEEQFQRYQAKREELETLKTEHSTEELNELLAQLHHKGEQLSLLLREHSVLHQGTVPTYQLLALCLGSTLLLTYFHDVIAANPQFRLTALLFIALSCLFGASTLIARLRRRRRHARVAANLLQDSAAESLENLRMQMAKEIAGLHVLRERSLRGEAAKQQLRTIGAELDRRNEQLSILGQRYGAHPERVRGALPYFLEKLTEYQKAVRNYQALNERVAQVKTLYQTQLAEFNASLADFDIPESRTPAEASAALSTLQIKTREQAATQAEIRRFKERISLLRTNLREAEDGMQQTLDGLGVSAADALELPELEAAHPSYQSLLRAKENLLLKAESLSEELHAEDQSLLTLSKEELESETESLSDQQKLKDELLQTTAKVAEDIQRTKRARAMERAIFDSEQSEAKLYQLYEKQKSDALSTLLLDTVERQYREQSLPEVLQVATDLFTLFTKGCYELLPSDAAPNTPLGFRAKETSSGEILTLRELSRGTRTQLLLAARLAFAKRHELKHPLPIVMDEVLSTSDPQRFAAIAEALLRLSVEEDRQIIYFSSQPEDLARWQAVSRSLGIGEITFEELDAGIKRFEVSAPTLLSARSPLKPLADESYEQYLERLAVPEIDSNADAAAIHIAHLLDSTQRLHALLRLGIERFSQILVLRKHGSDLVSDEEFESMQAKADVYACTAKALRLGRGKPLTPEVVLQQNLSESFTQPLIELLERVDYDAVKFISALKDKAIPKFRQSTISTFESRFVHEGFMSTEQPLSEEDARTRVIAEVSPHLQTKRLSAESFDLLFSNLWQRLETKHTKDSH